MPAVMERFVQDLRYSFRRFRRSPGFVVVAVLLMTIGIGASALIFTVADALLFRPLPVRDPQNLVELFERYPNIRPQSHLPYALYEEIRRQSSAEQYGWEGTLSRSPASCEKDLTE